MSSITYKLVREKYVIQKDGTYFALTRFQVDELVQILQEIQQQESPQNDTSCQQ